SSTCTNSADNTAFPTSSTTRTPLKAESSAHAVFPSSTDTTAGNPTMNARTDTAVLQPAAHHLSNRHLDALEEETIFILREVAAAFERPALLFSGGKDSLVMLKCAEKAFGAGRIPYPLL